MRVIGAWIVSITMWCGVVSTPIVCAESDSKTVQVSATILPRLELSITPETGSGIAFGAIEQPVRGTETTRSVAVNVGIFSNLGHPYHVTQMVRHPLRNPAGASIPEAQWTVVTHEAARGMVGAPEPTIVRSGIPTTLYLSNDIGKSDAFLADYTLRVTPTTPAGDFDTEIVYTVTSL